MKTRPQITIVEPRIRIPVWRSASPKNWKTRPVKTRPMTRAQKPKISPIELSQPRGTAVQPAPISLPSSGTTIYLITCSSGWVASSVWVKT